MPLDPVRGVIKPQPCQTSWILLYLTEWRPGICFGLVPTKIERGEETSVIFSIFPAIRRKFAHRRRPGLAGMLQEQRIVLLYCVEKNKKTDSKVLMVASFKSPL